MTDVLVANAHSGRLRREQSRDWLRSSADVRSIPDAIDDDSVYMSTVAVQPASIAQLVEQLNELASLRVNWDGASARPVSALAIQAVAQLLPTLSGWHTTPQLVPTCEGGISVEVHTLQGDLSIELSPSGAADLFLSDAIAGTEDEGPLGAMIERHRAALVRIIRG